MKDKQIIRVKVKLTNNRPFPTDLHVEVEDANTKEPVGAFPSLKVAHQWLVEGSYTYLHGSNGLWTR